MNATAAANEYPVCHDWTDPETGHRWIHLAMTAPFDYDQVRCTPQALRLDGDLFVRTGWNSDKGRIYYRNHMITAQGA